MKFKSQKFAFIFCPVLYVLIFLLLCSNFKDDYLAVQNHIYPVLNLLYIFSADVILTVWLLIFSSNLKANFAAGVAFVLLVALYSPFNSLFGLFSNPVPLISSMLLTYLAGLMVKYILRKSNKRLLNAIVGAYFSKKTRNKMMSGVMTECEPIKVPVTILECSIGNISALIENNLPKEVFSKINFVLDTVINSIIDNDGRVDKFIGTKIYAYWDKKNSSHLAVKAALDACKALEIAGESKDVKLNIGIHYDEVLVGLLGTTSVMNYSIVSPAIDIVDTIVASCSIYNKKVLISREVYKQGWRNLLAVKIATINIRGALMFTDLYEPLEVKSKRVGLKND